MNDKTLKTGQSDDVCLPICEFSQLKRLQAFQTNKARACYARLTNNQLCYRAINHRYIKGFKRMPDLPKLTSAGERVVGDLRSNGIAFANFFEFFEKPFYELINHHFYTYLEEFQKNISTSSFKGKSVYLDTIHKAHTFISDDPVSSFLSAPMFANIAAHYLQMIPRFVGSSFWRSRPCMDSKDRIYSQQWHRDYNDRSLVKIFMYITDVGHKQGYFEYLTGSHSYGKLRHIYDRIGPDGYRQYPDTENIAQFMKNIPVLSLDTIANEHTYGNTAPWQDKPTAIQCVAPKATLIFADTFGLHRGGFVEEQYRDVIAITYSTNFNVHKPHFAVTKQFSENLNPFMQQIFGLI